MSQEDFIGRQVLLMDITLKPFLFNVWDCVRFAIILPQNKLGNDTFLGEIDQCLIEDSIFFEVRQIAAKAFGRNSGF